MKSGANFMDQNRIKEMIEAGKDAKEISDALYINLDHIETYVKKTVKKAVKKSDG